MIRKTILAAAHFPFCVISDTSTSEKDPVPHQTRGIADQEAGPSHADRGHLPVPHPTPSEPVGRAVTARGIDDYPCRAPNREYAGCSFPEQEIFYQGHFENTRFFPSTTPLENLDRTMIRAFPSGNDAESRQGR